MMSAVRPMIPRNAIVMLKSTRRHATRSRSDGLGLNPILSRCQPYGSVRCATAPPCQTPPTIPWVGDALPLLKVCPRSACSGGYGPMRLQHLCQQSPDTDRFRQKLLEEARDERIGGTGLPHDHRGIRQRVLVSAE